ncbi:MAG: NifB/NifX family molybdenum-iron cluster-binding protein [Acidilobaceae archaeon]|nr:NifB/NifX family molybdenum-iron cluster-binding protein [Acidilobaceae archaeon]
MRAIVPVMRGKEGWELSPLFGRSKLFALVEIGEQGYRLLEVVENPFALSPEGSRAQGLAELMRSKGVEAIISTHVGPGGFYLFKQMGIKIYYVEGRMSLEEVVRAFVEGRAREAEGPREHR